MINAFVWYWPSGSVVEDCKNQSMYFAIITHWKRAESFIEQILIPFTQGCIVPRFDWNRPNGSEVEGFFFFIYECFFRLFVIISLLNMAESFIWANLNTFTQECFVPNLVEIGPFNLEKNIS